MKRTLILLTALLLTLLAAAHAADPVTTQARWENSELIYEQPAMSPDAGQPIGNGRMGTMFWTSPDAIHLQINRVDVFAVNRDHQGQPGQRGSATDYCGGIAAVVVHVGGQPFAPGEKSFRQRLSLESAECAIESTSLHVRCFISADSDVLVMEVDDRRASPERLKVTVSMLRQPEVRAGKNIATSTFREDQSRVVLTQRFREQDYHNASAVAVGVAGNGAVIDQPSATSRTLVLPTAQKKQVILISSAAAWEPERDVAEAAVALVNAARSRSVGDSRRKLSHERQEARLTDLASRRRRRMSAALSPARKVHAASGVQPALGNPHGCEAADPARDGSRSPLALKRHSPERSASQGGIRATAALH